MKRPLAIALVVIGLIVSYKSFALENELVTNDLYNDYHQYLPYHPTAQTLYPRVIQKEVGKDITWVEGMGRTEYLHVVEVEKEEVNLSCPTVDRFVYIPAPKDAPKPIPKKKSFKRICK
jgi:hypothetical protein